ncbi:MAG: beta strand repeat-containing protein, partial [Gammaproteobacteria bacterium]
MFLGLVAGLSAGVSAQANPSGAQVAHGTVNMQVNGKTLNITNSPNAIINWRRFGIAAGETTHFHQQSAASAVLNRVTGGDPSRILGALRSNGRVFLINPSGIVFGQGARVDTAGFIASTLNMSDEDFLRGNYSFAGGGDGGILNEGVIRAGEGGNVILIAPDIENGGVIEVLDGGQIVLAAGKEIALTSWENPTIRYQVSAPENEVLNLGQVLTDGGAARLFAGTVRHSGEVRAEGVRVGKDGAIELFASNEVDVAEGAVLRASGVENGGTIRIESDQGVTRLAGVADVSSVNGSGGRVDVFGREVTLAGSSRIEADGATGGGSVRVGGDYQGGGDVQRAQTTTFERGARINASATDAGDGGRVILWADDHTTSRGSIAIRGGANGGDGGFAEVSGKIGLEYDTVVDASAALGEVGTVFLDPTNGCISTSGTCSSGGFTGVTVASVEASVADYVLSATNDIEIENSITMTNAVSFTLQASNDITFFNNAVVITKGKSITLDAGNSISLGANSGLNTTGSGSAGADITLGATSGTITNQGTIIAGTGQINASAGGSVHLGDGTNADFLDASALLISGSGEITASSGNNTISHFEATNNGDATAITFVNDFLGTFTIGDVTNNGTSAGSDIHISTSSGGVNCAGNACGMDITGTISANTDNSQIFLATNVGGTTTGSNVGNSGTGRIVGDFVQVDAHAITLDGGEANQINTFTADVSGSNGGDDLTLTYTGSITLDGVQVDNGDLKVEGDATDCATADCDMVLAGGVRNFSSGGQTVLDTGGGGTITSEDSSGIIEAKNLFLQTDAGTGQIGTDPSQAGGQSLFLDGTAHGITNLTVGNVGSSVDGVYIHQTNNTLSIDGLDINSPVRLEVNNDGTLTFGAGFGGAGIDTGTDELFLSAGQIDLTNAGNLEGDSITLVGGPGGITFGGNLISAVSVDIDGGSPSLDLSGVSIQAQNAGDEGALNLATEASIISDAGTFITADSVSVSAGGSVDLANAAHAIEHFSGTLSGPGNLDLKVGNDLSIDGVLSTDTSGAANVFTIVGADGCASSDCNFSIDSAIEMQHANGIVRIDTGGTGSITAQTSGPAIIADTVKLFYDGGTGDVGDFGGNALRLASVTGSTSTSVEIGSTNPVGDVNLRHMGDKIGNASDLIVDALVPGANSNVRFEVDNGDLDLDPLASGVDLDLGAGVFEVEVRGGTLLAGVPFTKIDAAEVSIDVEEDLSFTQGRIRAPGNINLRVGGNGNTLAFAQTGNFFLCSGFDGTSCSGTGTGFNPFISLSADRMIFGTGGNNLSMESVDGEVAIGSATENLDIRIVNTVSGSFANALELTPEMLGRVGGTTREL